MLIFFLQVTELTATIFNMLQQLCKVKSITVDSTVSTVSTVGSKMSEFDRKKTSPAPLSHCSHVLHGVQLLAVTGKLWTSVEVISSDYSDHSGATTRQFASTHHH